MKIPRASLKRFILAAAGSGAVPLGLLAGGYVVVGATPYRAGLAAGGVLLSALVMGALFAVDRKFWFTGTAMGLAVGTAFAADLLFEVPFEDQFAVAAMTLMFFVALGFMLGAIAEFIHLLHHAAHFGHIEHCVAEPDKEPEGEPPVAET